MQFKNLNTDKNQYFRICPTCGASLDPGEHCDCNQKKANPEKEENQKKEGA